VSNNFDLFLLHKDYDIHPRSWICIKGNYIREIINDLENEIKVNNKINREQIAKIISKKLNCNRSVIKTLLQGKKYYYPLPVIFQLVELSKNRKYYLERTYQRIEFLKVNSASSKPVKAVRRINIELAKILGAFMADGSLSYQIILACKNKSKLKNAKNILRNIDIKFSEAYSRTRKEYYMSFNPNYKNFSRVENLFRLFSKELQIQTHMNIELTDEHRSSVEAFNRWIKNCFDIKPTSFKRKGNAWRTIFSNKILGRYLICFFNIKSGYKTDIAFEPSLIKNSPFSIRKAFALGVLTFDGSSSIGGTLSFGTKSKALAKSITNIFDRSKISFNCSINRGDFCINTHKNNVKSNVLNFFEKDTTKWLRYKESYRKSNNPYFEERYKVYSKNKITFKKILSVLSKVRICDIKFLSRCFNCNHSAVANYLNILKNNGKIKLSYNPNCIDTDYVDSRTAVFLKDRFHRKLFSTIEKKFVEYQKFGSFTGVHKSTISAWKLKKNRMPIFQLKTFCSILKLDFSLVLNNIEQTDRKIVQFLS
jgi:hypothetical protein